MKRLALLALMLLAVASAMGGFHEWTPPAHAAATAPTKVAIIELENRASATVLNASNMPYLNGTIKTDSETLTLDSMLEGVASQNGTSPSGSAEEYAFQTSADNCGGTVDDGYMNNNGASPISSTLCGTDIFADLTAASVSWKGYAENFVSVSCTAGYGDTFVSGGTNKHNGYARKHQPTLFYADNLTSPYTSCPNTIPFPHNDTSSTPHGIVQNFDGTETLPSFSFIEPNLCHDQHNGSTLCQPNGAPPTTPDVYNGDGATTSPCGGAALTNVIKAGDCWLQKNWANIRADVGANGVVVVLYDEDGTSTGGRGAIAATITAGTGGVLHGDSNCSGFPISGGCTSHTAYDQASVFRGIAQAFLGTSCPSGLTTVGASNCAAVADLPIQLETTPTGPATVQGAQTLTSGATSSVSVSWPAATTQHDFLVAAVAAKGTAGTITPPSGWTLAKTQGNQVSIYFCADCAVQSGSQTWTFATGETHRAAALMWEYSGIATTAAKDQSASATSNANLEVHALSGTPASATSTASEVAFSAVMNNSQVDASFEPPNTGTGCYSTTGWDEVDQASNGFLGLQLNLQIMPSTGTPCSVSVFGDDSTWRGALATFTN